MNTSPTSILSCYILENTGTPQATTNDPSLEHVGRIIAAEFYLPITRSHFFDLLKTVQDSIDPNAEKICMGNLYGYILTKNTITILRQNSATLDQVLTVPLSLFVSALYEWIEYLQKMFPKYVE
jgi:hypothetical protein